MLNMKKRKFAIWSTDYPKSEYSLFVPLNSYV
jgi:hypothetical protein